MVPCWLLPRLLLHALAAALVFHRPCSAAPRRGACERAGVQRHERPLANATRRRRGAAASEILRLARLKLWSEAAECLSALDQEAGDNLPRDSALCAVAVNTMARLRRPAAAARYLRLMAPVAKAPVSALGALLKAYAVVNDLPRARSVLACILAGAGGAQAESVRQEHGDEQDQRCASKEMRRPAGLSAGNATQRVREGCGRALSTYLRCCVRTGNMRAAGEALEMFGGAWLLDETCCFLVVQLLCLTLHVDEAWWVACASLRNSKVAEDAGSGGRGRGGGQRTAHVRVARAGMCVTLAKACVFVGYDALAMRCIQLTEGLLQPGDWSEQGKFLQMKAEEIISASRALAQAVSSRAGCRGGGVTGLAWAGSSREVMFWFDRLLVLPDLADSTRRGSADPARSRGDGLLHLACASLESGFESCGLAQALGFVSSRRASPVVGGGGGDGGSGGDRGEDDVAREQAAGERGGAGAGARAGRKGKGGGIDRALQVGEELHQRLVRLLCKGGNTTRGISPADYRLAVQTRQNLFHADGTLRLSTLFRDPAPGSRGAESGEESVREHVTSTGQRRVYLELGSGDGEWAVDSAKRARELGANALWVCVELRLDRAIEAHRRVVTNRLSNVLVICADACALLERGLRSSSIAAIFVRFPQPPPRVVAARLAPFSSADADGASAGTAREEEEDQGADEHLLSRACLAHMWHVLRPTACLHVLTDSLALARLAAATAAGGGVPVDSEVPVRSAGTSAAASEGRACASARGREHGASAASRRARGAWLSERLCVRSSRDPTPSSDRPRKQAGAGGDVGRAGLSVEGVVSGVEASREGMVIEEEVSGVVIYRLRQRASDSFFGRMWQRGGAPNFLLRLRKSECGRSAGECSGRPVRGGLTRESERVRELTRPASSVGSAAFYH